MADVFDGRLLCALTRELILSACRHPVFGRRNTMTSNLIRLELTNTLELNRFGLASWGVYGSAALEHGHALEEAEITTGRLGGDGPFL